MSRTQSHLFRSKDRQRSFSLFETVLAIGMIASVLIHVNGIQGQAIYSVEYQENLSKGHWIAKALMSKVEYEWMKRPFSDMKYKPTETRIKDSLWGRGMEKAFPDFTYTVSIEEWKLPLMNLIMGGGAGGEDEEGDNGLGGSADLISSQIKAILGDEFLKIAHVEVFWPEGARRGSTDLAFLLTNQKVIDEKIKEMKGLQQKKEKKKKNNTRNEDEDEGPGRSGVRGGDGSDGL